MQRTQFPGRAGSAHQPLVAINAGFNRIRPDGPWVLQRQDSCGSPDRSNRGRRRLATQELPQFGRLRLKNATDETGRRLAGLTQVNSGYVQRAWARYTPTGGAVWPWAGAEKNPGGGAWGFFF